MRINTNKLIYWALTVFAFALLGYLGGRREEADWIFSFILYFYFSSLVACFLFGDAMWLPYAVVKKENPVLRLVIFIVSIIAMLIFGFFV